MQVKDILKLFEGRDPESPVLLSVNLPEQGSWSNSRAEMTLGNMRISGKLDDYEGTEELYCTFNCELKTF